MLTPPPIDPPERFPPLEALLEISMDTATQIKEKIAQLTLQLEKLKIEGMIRDIAKLHGVDPDKAVEVARRESSLNPKAIHINNDKWRSVDRGLYQINSVWWKSVSDEQAFDPVFSARFFIEHIKKGNSKMWIGAKGIFYDTG